uniref:Translocase of inner mitochondrial membrane 13 n=1 Tax=Leptobrachium leishanense TaxID=445787 RepID=A0A8C5P6T1_9ANUR
MHSCFPVALLCIILYLLFYLIKVTPPPQRTVNIILPNWQDTDNILQYNLQLRFSNLSIDGQCFPTPAHLNVVNKQLQRPLCLASREVDAVFPVPATAGSLSHVSDFESAGQITTAMDGFGSEFASGASGSGKVDTGAIMEQVKVQIAVANAQELLQRMTEKCFRKCIGKPGSSLDNSEQKCVAMCMDRYMDAWNTVSRAYNARLQRESAKM